MNRILPLLLLGACAGIDPATELVSAPLCITSFEASVREGPNAGTDVLGVLVLAPAFKPPEGEKQPIRMTVPFEKLPE